MKKLFIYLFSLALFSCTPDKATLLKDIASLETAFEKKETGKKLDMKAGNELFEKYDLFLENYSKDSLAPILLFKAGKLAVAINNHTKAIKYLGEFTESYKDSPDAPQAYLLLGNYYANKVLDLDNAKMTFNAFIDQFPNHPMVKDVKFMVTTLGKTPDEILELIQQRNSKQDSL